MNKEKVVTIQRIENAAIALVIMTSVVVLGWPWWVLLAAFLLFDLSAIGYVRNTRLGAVTYNVVHNYTTPAVLMLCYIFLYSNGVEAIWLAVLAASWAFHVAVDRAVGYGLKLHNFQDTHLGKFGPNRH